MVAADDELDDDGASGLLLPPDDRLWRHPSELSVGRTISPALRRGDNRMWLVAVLAGAIGALLATGVGIATGRLRTRTVPVTAVEQELVSPVVTLASTGAAAALTAGAARVEGSCAHLVATDAHGVRTSTGVIFRSDGMVLTTAHTVTGAQTLYATVAGHPRATAHVVASDPGTDLAVLRLDGNGYQPAPMGTALELRAGDPVIALEPESADGNQGSVDSFGATVPYGSGRLTGLLRVTTTKALTTIGGPVLDDRGAVVGIATALGSPGGTVEFATPVDLAREVAAQLMSKGRVTPVWLGVEGHDLASDKATAEGLLGGAIVDKIYGSSPASEGGLHPGDTVLGVDGRAVTSMAALILAMHALPPGSRISLAVRRDGTDRVLTVILAPRPNWLN